MKDIKPFLPLYMGCEVSVTNLDGRYTRILDYEFFSSYYDADEDEFLNDPKPILRKLDSMTDIEIIDLVKIMLDKNDVHVVIDRTEEGDYIMAKYNTAYPESDFDKSRYDRIDMYLIISNLYGNLSLQNNWSYVKGNSTGSTNEQLYRHHEMTRHLLSKHFDLFELIEDGLALDRSTLTH